MVRALPSMVVGVLSPDLSPSYPSCSIGLCGFGAYRARPEPPLDAGATGGPRRSETGHAKVQDGELLVDQTSLRDPWIGWLVRNHVFKRTAGESPTGKMTKKDTNR